MEISVGRSFSSAILGGAKAPPYMDQPRPTRVTGASKHSTSPW